LLINGIYNVGIIRLFFNFQFVENVTFSDSPELNSGFTLDYGMGNPKDISTAASGNNSTTLESFRQAFTNQGREEALQPSPYSWNPTNSSPIEDSLMDSLYTNQQDPKLQVPQLLGPQHQHHYNHHQHHHQQQKQQQHHYHQQQHIHQQQQQQLPQQPSNEDHYDVPYHQQHFFQNQNQSEVGRLQQNLEWTFPLQQEHPLRCLEVDGDHQMHDFIDLSEAKTMNNI